VATGGMTSGSVIRVSMMDLPGQSRRASAQAAARPNGRMTAVLNAETHAVNQTICHSSSDIHVARECPDPRVRHRLDNRTVASPFRFVYQKECRVCSSLTHAR